MLLVVHLKLQQEIDSTCSYIKPHSEGGLDFGSQDVNGQFVRIREVQTKVEEDMSCAGDNAEIIDYSEHQRCGPQKKKV